MSGEIEFIQSRNSAEDMAFTLQAIMADHSPEIYYGRGGKEQGYCKTCGSDSETREEQNFGNPLSACSTYDHLLDLQLPR